MEFFNSVKNYTVKIPRGEIIQKMLSSQGEMIILSRFDISESNNEVDFTFNETDYLESESKNIVLSEQIKRNSLCSFPEENLKLGYEYIVTPQNNKEIQIKTTMNDQSRIQLPLNSNKYLLSKFNEGNQINIDHHFVTLNL